jgi:formyl-CoA transferase
MAALDGMRVLDMTQYEAGTSCTQALAWLGADVVKVESPRGDPGRKSFSRGTPDSQYFLNYNANKRSVVLDLQTPDGKALLLRMAPKYDVFVENFGPGVMERLGLTYEAMSEANPGLIYTRMKGFGLTGPYAGYKSFDPLAQAAAGVFSVSGTPEGPPLRTGGTFSDTGTGMQTALAIVAAYVQQQRTGKGQAIEVSMQEATLNFMKTVTLGEWNTGEAVPRRGNRGGAPTGMYPCAGGGPNDYLYILIATSRMWDTLCTVIERPDLITDPKYATPRDRAANADELDEEISKWTRQHDKHEAMRILAGNDVPVSAVFDSVDMFDDPHLTERGFFQKVDHPVEGELTLMGPTFRMSESDVELERPPMLDEHTDDVLASDLGIGAGELRGLRGTGAIGVHSRWGAAP